MACFNTNTNNNTNTQKGTIADLLRKINQIQREAVLNNLENACETCMIGQVYNTKPIAIYTCCGNRFAVAGTYQDTESNINLFRVEEVRGNDTVVLRLIERDGTTFTCTRQTVVLNISCICCIECFEPINCQSCRQTAATTTE